MLTSFASRLLIALAATTICACNFLMSSRKADETHSALMVYRMDHAHVFVTPDDLPPSRPYHVLGELRYTSAFSTDAIDSAQTTVRLKNMALAEYPDTVDAVIKADTQVVGTDDMVVVTGEAVQFDMSADRNMMHDLIWEGAIVSPK
jgi:hypothetical protein